MGVAGGPVIPQSGLQLCLDAGNTKSSPASGTTWFDISGNGRDFTWASAPTYNAAGTVSGYRVPANISAARATGPASNSFGIDSSSGASFMLFGTNNASNNQAAFKWYMDGGDAFLRRGHFAHIVWGNANIYYDSNGSYSTSSGGGRVNGAVTGCVGGVYNYFHDYVLTKSADGATMKIYADGVEKASSTNRGANPTLNSTGANIGGTESYSVWDARMTLFLCYNRELTAAEVKQISAAYRGREGLNR